MDFDRHTLVLLRRPPDAPNHSEAEIDELHAGRLGHLRTMRERGVIAAAGPFDDPEDQTMRGLGVYAVPADEARRLADQDPVVRARRMTPQVLTWLTPEGEAQFGSA